MVSFQPRSYHYGMLPSLDQSSKLSRESLAIHDDFKQVETNIDETCQAIEEHRPRQVIEKNLDKLELQLHKVHPEVTEITEEACLSPRDKKFLAAESDILTTKLNNLSRDLPDRNLRGKATYLREEQKTFHALMDYEFKFPGRDPERTNEDSFDKQFRGWVNETLRSMEEAKRLTEASKFHKTGLTLKAVKPAAGLAY